MSEIEELLQNEGVGDSGDLLHWARARSAVLLADLDAESDLANLLGGSGVPLASRAPLPPIPVTADPSPQAAGPATDQTEDIEEIDVEELELLEEDFEEEETAEHSLVGETSSGALALAGQPDAEPSEPENEPSVDDSQARMQAFGPPDGTDNVPEWKAALLSAETDDDVEAAARVKEASSAQPLPQAPARPETQRLEAEEEEISKHTIDLSDLDGDT